MTATLTRTPPRRWTPRLSWSNWITVGLSVLLVGATVLAGVLSPFGPGDLVDSARLAPSLAHPLGTDHLGRDVLSRTLWGGQNTLLMAFASTAIAAVFGVPLGIFAGYYGKVRAAVTMRVMDVLLAFPGMLLALVIITVAGGGIATTILAVGISFIPVFARVMYGTTQRVREEEYIQAARVIGCSGPHIMLRHVLPVVLTEVVVLVSSAIGWTALLCASLNFLGFGVQPPTAEWGADLGTGSKYLAQAWWISAGPGLAITLTILLSNFLGDLFAKRLDAQPILAPGAAGPTP